MQPFFAYLSCWHASVEPTTILKHSIDLEENKLLFFTFIAIVEGFTATFFSLPLQKNKKGDFNDSDT